MNRWIKTHRFAMQIAALLAALASSFGLYASLEAGNAGVSVALFAALVLSMVLTALAG